MQTNIDTFSTPGCHLYTFRPGFYYLILYGAQGGNCSNKVPYGGYSSGILRITQIKNYYLCVGGSGVTNKDDAVAGGENGGGSGKSGESNQCSGSGGGMSDIRKDKNDKATIIIAACGGGGDGFHENTTYLGGRGGGISGEDGQGPDQTAGKGGSLINEGGSGGSYPGKFYDNDYRWYPCNASNGSKYKGGNSCTTAKGSSGGGGGGYYGGGGGADIGGGGGGSGYISFSIIQGKTGTSTHTGNGEILIISNFKFFTCNIQNTNIIAIYTTILFMYQS